MKSHIERRKSTTRSGSLSSRREVVSCSGAAISHSGSQTVIQLPDDRLEIPDDPRRIFKKVIAENDHVCQECYQRLRRYQEFPWRVGVERHNVLAFVEEDLPDGSEWNYLDREYFESIKLEERLGRTYTDAGKGTYCTGCGTMDPHRSPSTRSAERARDDAVQLTVTLHEYGVDHDWVHLVERVQELKRQPETAGNDFECFKRATAEAVVRAQHQTDPRP
ncbi:CxxC motif protein [Halobacterium phage ChaoS9]|uniref:CxxC motif protein n=1 Tax=Halobacterium phage ChaoS9 TaxID=2847105 RepID=A0A481V8E9_9CAUD|nr:CxxC motif protein [Halobacterium phage ChaoS9]QBI90084.1 CxxC motif protein [Halobacterium phage ChaoS9]